MGHQEHVVDPPVGRWGLAPVRILVGVVKASAIVERHFPLVVHRVLGFLCTGGLATRCAPGGGGCYGAGTQGRGIHRVRRGHMGCECSYWRMRVYLSNTVAPRKWHMTHGISLIDTKLTSWVGPLGLDSIAHRGPQHAPQSLHYGCTRVIVLSARCMIHKERRAGVSHAVVDRRKSTQTGAHKSYTGTFISRTIQVKLPAKLYTNPRRRASECRTYL